MELNKPSDLLILTTGNIITKRNLFDLIQYSKVAGSHYWEANEVQIGNTPQQGINWIGELPLCHGVIIKTRPGSYQEDGWADPSKLKYHYSFKAKKGEISYTEKANSVLVNQPRYQYPILLFTEKGNSWLYEGNFAVSEIENKFVVLERKTSAAQGLILSQDEAIYQEGGKKYVTHLMTERNRAVIKAIKTNLKWVCDICKTSFTDRYGVDYIEAHHKISVSTYSSSYAVKLEDFALLCPNCHKAVHIYMKKDELDYAKIKEMLSGIKSLRFD